MDKESFTDKCSRLGLYDKSLEEIIDIIDEKDKEIARLKEATIDVWIKVPKEDSDG